MSFDKKKKSLRVSIRKHQQTEKNMAGELRKRPVTCGRMLTERRQIKDAIKILAMCNISHSGVCPIGQCL